MADGDLVLARPEERQRFTRRAVIIAARLRTTDQAVDCDILDISAGGAKLRSDRAWADGSAVILTVDGVCDLAARVAWRTAEGCGIAFLDSPELVAATIPRIMKAADESRERRAATRSSVLWMVDLYAGIRRARCEVLNVSRSGVRLRASVPFEAGCPLILRSPRFGELNGEVVWRRDDLLGVRFTDSDEAVTGAIEKLIPAMRREDDE